jgi:hypothetical protein
MTGWIETAFRESLKLDRRSALKDGKYFFHALVSTGHDTHASMLVDRLNQLATCSNQRTSIKRLVRSYIAEDYHFFASTNGEPRFFS